MKRNTYVILAAIIAAACLIVFPMALAIRDMIVEGDSLEVPPDAGPKAPAPAEPGTPPGSGDAPNDPPK